MEILLSKRLSGLMAEENLTGKQLATKTNITEGTISKILTGVNTNPKSDTIITLAKYFNVSSDYLLGLSEYKTPQAADIGAVTGLSDENITAMKGHMLELNSDIDEWDDAEPFVTLAKNFKDYYIKILNTLLSEVLVNNKHFIKELSICKDCFLSAYTVDEWFNGTEHDKSVMRIKALLQGEQKLKYCYDKMKRITEQCVSYDGEKVKDIIFDNAYVLGGNNDSESKE